ncbi:MAG: glycine cleavage system aminomethyltransferase GcvT [Propionibacteriaceae bacterium]|nr:glycine cleavage system aminomethyltransferase GcvT [Propionibacteriaceae bacterium]
MTDHRPPLYDVHVSLGAKFGGFGGWSMPLEYAGGGVLAEHAAVRQGVGLFDVSHLGKLLVSGPGTVAYLNTRLANDLGRIGSGQAQYTLLCNDTGGVVDDLIAYRFSDDRVLLVPNAANTASVAGILCNGLPDGITITNQHEDYVVLAVQGPASGNVMAALGFPDAMDYMAFEVAEFGGQTLTVCRTGYTGEHGYELVAPNAVAEPLWAAILSAGQPSGIRACGLGARDTLRTEMGYPLHGQDITPAINPVEAGLGWAVGWAKPSFDGADVLRRIKEDGPQRRLRGIKAKARGIPRAGMTVVEEGGAALGEVTSGTFSPTLRTGIGLALVSASAGDSVGVQIRQTVELFDVVKLPFVDSHVR